MPIIVDCRPSDRARSVTAWPWECSAVQTLLKGLTPSVLWFVVRAKYHRVRHYLVRQVFDDNMCAVISRVCTWYFFARSYIVTRLGKWSLCYRSQNRHETPVAYFAKIHNVQLSIIRRSFFSVQHSSIFAVMAAALWAAAAVVGTVGVLSFFKICTILDVVGVGFHSMYCIDLFLFFWHVRVSHPFFLTGRESVKVLAPS